SLVLIMMLVPRFIFRSRYDGVVEQSFENAVRMSFLLIVIGYVSVMLGLFEFISIVSILCWISIRLYRHRQKIQSMNGHITSVEAMIYDYFDGKYKLIQLFRYYTAQYLSNILKFW